jgi:hypothetical protein
MLKIINKHTRDSHIQFFEKEHKYVIDGDENYISVTTLIKSFFPKFDADGVIHNWMKNPQKWLTNKYYGKTKEEIKQEWKEKGEQSASLGTLLHLSIENYYNQIPQTIESIIEKEYYMFESFHTQISQSLIPYRTEWYVYDTDYNIAGSIDMVYKDNENKYHIYDWKRTVELKKKNPFQQGFYPFQDMEDTNYNHYSLQLNLYKYILEKNYNISIQSMNLVCLHPANQTFIIESVPDIQLRIQKMLQFYKDNKELIYQYQQIV